MDEKTDFVTKLQQIEEQANSMAAELPPGIAKTRALHIVLLAKTLRSRLEFGSVVIRPDTGSTKPSSEAD